MVLARLYKNRHGYMGNDMFKMKLGFYHIVPLAEG